MTNNREKNAADLAHEDAVRKAARDIVFANPGLVPAEEDMPEDWAAWAAPQLAEIDLGICALHDIESMVDSLHEHRNAYDFSPALTRHLRGIHPDMAPDAICIERNAIDTEDGPAIELVARRYDQGQIIPDKKWAVTLSAEDVLRIEGKEPEVSEHLPNTCFTYTYRDGSNFKVSTDVILPGHLSDAQKMAIFEKADAEYGQPSIIPGQIGLPDLQDNFHGVSFWKDDSDHPWHLLEGISDTDAEVTDNQQFTALATFIMVEKVIWDQGWKPAFYPLMKLRELGFEDDEAGGFHSMENGDGTGLWYTLGLHPKAAHIRDHEDEDMVYINHGEIVLKAKEVESDLETCGYEINDQAQVRAEAVAEAWASGLDALGLIIEAAFASRGIEGEDIEVSKSEIEAAGGPDAYLRNLLGLPEAYSMPKPE